MNLEAQADVIEVVDLEPITIGEVTEVTGAGHGDEEEDNIVWGNLIPE